MDTHFCFHENTEEPSIQARMKTMNLQECRILAMVMAGGKGKRLYPLTEHRAKSAVPIGGMCRLIDFVMSNMVNSGIRKIYVLTQYKAQSLLRHLQQEWTIPRPMNGYSVMALPSQMQSRNTLYLGTADSIYKNLELIRRTIIDQGSIIEAGERIGFNPVYDAGRYYLGRSGIVVVSPRKAAS